ncbi:MULTISPECIES: DUF2911 domain-containing protein [Roseivirga]|jgi:hypothetical protein|uniref:Asparagine synthetase B n=1 Tax=Roseivirga thermotolerans TaxID=1758176 RepID=A0ABQ3I8L9_9BACT|nr:MULTISPECIES: DUF2911 domain-containing protein [Roseivirga]GHE73599.1 hypothetical protein GCM10011340_32870 [Roseivirga thermotolerans]|tara:strand:- start:3917 stop:4450 length:534 start_codon:yes stop_codon:yes gene_type:complete
MKKGFIALATLLFIFSANVVLAQRGPAASPTTTVSQMIGNTEMTLVYSRPSLDGRSLETLAPKGQVWRTGANANTKISFSKEVTIGGQKLPAGEYSMYSIPGDNEWTIIINKAKVWGTNYDESQDVIRFKAKATKTANSVETFYIMMQDFDKNNKNKATIELAWGNTSVKFPIEVTN